ncbi:helix-turn-helix domain-containing protein [Deltaproteobacteria bacterium PRO3]|nr:helix-turn-helix domain-containing protein [Deltaproteobacteria bacterium PRO3]
MAIIKVMELTFGENLRLMRVRAGKTAKEVAALAVTDDHPNGFHDATICKWEKTVRSWKSLPFAWIEALAAAIGCPVDDLKKEKAA